VGRIRWDQYAEFRTAKNHAVVSKLIAKLLAEHARIDNTGKMVIFVDDFRKGL